MTRIITGGDRRKEPRLGTFSSPSVVQRDDAVETESADMACGAMHQPPEIISDLNALFLMVGYIEMELQRIAPECVLFASSLRSAIINEMLLRDPSQEATSSFAWRHL